MMPKKRYLYVPAGKKLSDAKELGGVRDIEQKMMLLSQDIPLPMKYSNPANIEDDAQIAKSRKPRLIMDDGKKRRISTLTPLEWHENTMYQDTTPEKADTDTLKSLAYFFGDSKRMSYFAKVANTKSVKTGDIVHALKGQTWGKIAEGICRLDRATFDTFQLAVETLRQPPKSSPKWILEDSTVMNSETVDLLSLFCSGIRSAKRMEGLKDNDILGERELRKNIGWLGSVWKKRRHEASKKLFYHYQLVRYSVVQTPKDAEKALLRALDDPQENIRTNVSQTLGFINSYKAIDPIQERIRMADSDIEILDHMQALKYINNPRIIGIFARLGIEGSPGVREEAVDCMDQIINFKSFSEKDRKCAEDGLIKMGKKENDTKVKTKISRVLKKINAHSKEDDNA